MDAFAQDKVLDSLPTAVVNDASSPKGEPRPSKPETLIMALKSDSVSSAEDVKLSLELANQEALKMPSPPFSFKGISGVRRIDRASYDLVWNPFPEVADATNSSAPAVSKANDAVVSVTSSPYSYIITTDHRAVAEEVEVRYTERDTSDVEQKTAAFTKAGDKQADSQFRRLRAGIHELTIQPTWEPTQYRIRFSVINDEETTEANSWTPWQEWPGGKTKFFLAKLEGFRGDPETIFEILREMEVALKFEQFDIRQRISYLAADLEVKPETFTETGLFLTDKGLRLDLAVPAELKATRVWALFPVDEEGVAKAIENLKRWPSSPFAKMQVLLGTAEGAAELNPYPKNEMPVGGNGLGAAIQPEPQWLLLPKMDSASGADKFSREFQVQQDSALGDRLRAAKQMILIFERDPGNGDKFRGIITFSRDEKQEGFWDVRNIRSTSGE